MPTSKRERQRAGRQAARAAARAAQRRTQRRRQIITAVVAVLVVAGIGVVISLRGGNDNSSSASSGSTTSSTASTGSTAVSTTAPPTTMAPIEPACPPAEGSPERHANFTKAPGMCIDAQKTYQAVVDTDAGSFTIDLATAKAPQTVNNFVFLARYHAFDGVPFHRVIPGFVVQGGDVALRNGTGGPGYTIPDELPKQGEYKIGSVAMANSGSANSGGSQFFVVTGDQGVALPPQYSLFGQVSAGLDVVKKIEADGSASGTPATTHSITKVTIKES